MDISSSGTKEEPKSPMRRVLFATVIAALLPFAGVAEAQSHGGGAPHGGGSGNWHGGGGNNWHGGGGWHGEGWHGSVGVYFGPYWGWAWPYYYGYPYGYPYAYPFAYYPYDYPYYDPYPAYAPNTFVAPAPSAPSTVYWYYCTDPAGYYPYVRTCSKPWMPVLPQNVPPEESAPPASPPPGAGAQK